MTNQNAVNAVVESKGWEYLSTPHMTAWNALEAFSRRMQAEVVDTFDGEHETPCLMMAAEDVVLSVKLFGESTDNLPIIKITRVWRGEDGGISYGKTLSFKCQLIDEDWSFKKIESPEDGDSTTAH